MPQQPLGPPHQLPQPMHQPHQPNPHQQTPQMHTSFIKASPSPGISSPRTQSSHVNPTITVPMTPTIQASNTTTVNTANSSNNNNNTRSIKRPRPVKSCTECRKRKLRCDRGSPCVQCHKSQRDCRYASDPGSANMSDGSDGESAERPAKKMFSSGSASFGASGSITGDAKPLGIMRNGTYTTLEEILVRLERLEQANVAKSPARTDHSGSKVVVTAVSPKTIRQLTIKSDALRTRFFGQNSPRVLLNLVGSSSSYSILSLLLT